MPAAACSESEFVRVWMEQGHPSKVAAVLRVCAREVLARRRRIEQRLSIQLPIGGKMAEFQHEPSCAARQEIEVKNGCVLIGSDAHYWPGKASVAHEAFVTLARKLKPAAVILNGDIFDGARISRHDKFGWEQLPDVMRELAAVKTRTAEIERAAKGAMLLRTRGNHDLRFEKYLATNAPEFKDVTGFRLRDHLRAWRESWSVWINGDVVVKHKHHNGVHATWNNALRGGKTIVTGHLHRLQVTVLTDYNGTRWGVDTGTLSDPWGPQYEYLEDGVRNWMSGFAVLTFSGGKLLHPELCAVQDGKAYFRGAAV